MVSAPDGGSHRESGSLPKGFTMPKADALRTLIEAFPWARNQEVVVTKAGSGYSPLSARTGQPVARLKPTGEGDKVQVLW
jgi:hypothetical protein